MSWFEPLASLDESIKHVEHRVAGLEEQQAAHDAFSAEHHAEFGERELVRLATLARRLKLRLQAVADPPDAVLELLGPRPTGQRGRLRWDRAVEHLVVFFDATGRTMPDHAGTVAQLLGGRPGSPLDRFEHDRIAEVVRKVQAPERDLGRSVGRG